MPDQIIVIIGAGRIGRTMGSIFASTTPEAMIRFWDSHPHIVPDQKSLSETLSGATAVFLAVPALSLPSLVEELNKLPAGTPILTISKGVPDPAHLSPIEYLEALCPKQHVVVIGGPMMAEEMSAANPGQAVVAGRDQPALESVGAILIHSFITLTFSPDPVGVSRLGVMKNVYACISGMIDGRHEADQMKTTHHQEIIAEFQRVAESFSIAPELIAGPAGLGDLTVTMMSRHSRNRRSGETLARTGQRDETAEAIHSLPIIAASLPHEIAAPLLHIAAGILAGTAPVEKLDSAFGSTSIKPSNGSTLISAMDSRPPLAPEHAALVKEYEAAGWHHVHIREDAPKAIYPPHYHPDHVTLQVLAGELDIDIDGQHQVITPGQKIDVAAERFHTTCVGPTGCLYLHAEKNVTSS